MGKAIPYVDHFGQPFINKKEMLLYWGTNPGQFDGRIKRGWTRKEALTSIRDIENTQNYCQDHLGNKFESERQMCKQWNIEYSVYHRRVNKFHWDIEEALTGIRKIDESNFKYTDHNGNKFPSYREMAEYWSITYDTLIGRLNNGYTLKQALTNTPPQEKLIYACTDAFNNQFLSKTKMFEYWNVNKQAYETRLKKGCSKLEALGIIPCLTRAKYWKFNNNLTVIGKINNDYFTCFYNNHECILHHDFIIKYCTQELRKQFETKVPQPAYDYAEA